MLVISSAFRQISGMKHFLPLAALLIWVTGCAHLEPRADFLRVVERPRVALAPQAGTLPATNGLAQIYFSFSADAQNRVPGFLIKSAASQGRRPVVIALHGTGGSKSGMTALCRKLAERGFIAVAIDGRYHGERKTGKGQKHADPPMVQPAMHQFSLCH